MYRVNQLYLVDFLLRFPPCCLHAKPILSDLQLPKQNWADTEIMNLKSTKYSTRPDGSLFSSHLCLGRPGNKSALKQSEMAWWYWRGFIRNTNRTTTNLGGQSAPNCLPRGRVEFSSENFTYPLWTCGALCMKLSQYSKCKIYCRNLWPTRSRATPTLFGGLSGSGAVILALFGFSAVAAAAVAAAPFAFLGCGVQEFTGA